MRARPVVLVLGPSLQALSGVTTHVKALLGSRLSADYSLVHYQVGSEGRAESTAARLARFFLSPFALAAAIVRHDAAIVHVNTSLNAKAYWRDLQHVMAAKLCGARVVLQKHGGQLDEFARPAFFARFLGATLRLADVVVVLSDAEREAWRAFVPGQNVAAVPNGIDEVPYRKYNRAAADPARALKLLYLGRLAPGKGLAESLRALVAARARGAPANLVIAGGGPEEARLRASVRQLALEECVTFAGPAWGDYKLRLLCNADVLLLPSYSEGLPYALLEAMAAGAVPIVTPVGAIPEVVADGVHGRVVPVKDVAALARAIVELHGDRAALLRMSEAGRKRVATAYSIARLGLDFSSLYGSLNSWPASQAG